MNAAPEIISVNPHSCDSHKTYEKENWNESHHEGCTAVADASTRRACGRRGTGKKPRLPWTGGWDPSLGNGPRNPTAGLAAFTVPGQATNLSGDYSAKVWAGDAAARQGCDNAIFCSSGFSEVRFGSINLMIAQSGRR